MDAIRKIAFYKGIRSEGPNQELARELAISKDREGIRQIAGHLSDKNKSVASDCLKVLYEIGYIDPSLIAEFGATFADLLESRNNRMVWGAMIALATIAECESGLIWKSRARILDTIENGTVITEVWGLKALVGMIKADKRRGKDLGPFLMKYLREGRPVDLPTRIEDYEAIMDEGFAAQALDALRANDGTFKKSQLSRINRVLKRHGRLFEAR